VGQGRALPDPTRAALEPRFGADFSRVRVHADSEAQALTRSVNAAAFTVGHDIYFAPGKWDSTSSAGRRLLAHELTHVVQQASGRAPRDALQRQVEVTIGPACIELPGNDRVLGPSVMFARGSASLDRSARASVIDPFLRSWRGTASPIDVHGYASEDGAVANNQDLSCRRAAALARALIDSGVPEDDISRFGHGETRAYGAPAPAAREPDEESLRQNRRAVIVAGPAQAAPAPAPDPARAPEPDQPLAIHVTNDGDIVGWLGAATHIGELYMTDVDSMVTNVLTAIGSRQMSRLEIADHGNGTGVLIGSDFIDLSNIARFTPRLSALRGHFAPGAIVHLQHCSVGQNLPLIRAFASAFGVPVYAGTSFENAIYRFNLGDYVRCDPSGTCVSGVSRP